jgi:Transposase DDE domain
MHSQIMTFYQTCEAYLHQKGFEEDPQAQMTTVEVMTTALVAAFFFANNLRLACQTMAESGLVPGMLSESRFNRRWHRITQADWQAILTLLAQQNPADTFIVDSCPLAVCHKQRAKRCRLYQDTEGAYWGYCAAKEEYFYGLKAHVVITASGRPVEVLLLCGCSADLTGLKELELALPPGARLYADKAYTDYRYEDALQEDKQIMLLAIRKGNSTRPHQTEVAKALSYGRKRIETTFSQITAKLPRRIHAVRPAGFESKVMAIFVAFAIWCTQNEKIADARRAAS